MNRDEICRLAENAGAGDKKAFEELYREFRDKVYFFTKRYVGTEEAAEDVTSETFTSALEHIGSLRSGESFTGWLYSIAYRLCIEHFRASSRSGAFPEGELGDDASAMLTEPLMLPDDYAENEQTRLQLRSIIDSLPGDQRSAVILYYYEDLSVSEVAQSLGTNENAASQKLSRARKNIRRKVEKLIGKGALFALVPFEAMLRNTVEKAYVQAAVHGGARIARRSFAVKFIGLGAAAAVAVGVPIAMSRLTETKGDYRPYIENETDSELDAVKESESENSHFRIKLSTEACDDFRLSGTMTIEPLDDISRYYVRCAAAAYADSEESSKFTPTVKYSGVGSNQGQVTLDGFDRKKAADEGVYTVRFTVKIDRRFYNRPIQFTFYDTSDLIVDFSENTGTSDPKVISHGIFNGIYLSLDVRPTVKTYYYRSDDGRQVMLSKYGFYNYLGKDYDTKVSFDGGYEFTVNDVPWYKRNYDPENTEEITYYNVSYKRMGQ